MYRWKSCVDATRYSIVLLSICMLFIITDVNNNLIWDKNVLILFFVDQCDSGAGVDAFFHAIYTTKDPPVTLYSTSSTSSLSSGTGKTKTKLAMNKRPFIMLLGPHCSHVTESVASVTSYWNIVQVRFKEFVSYLFKTKRTKNGGKKMEKYCFVTRFLTRTRIVNLSSEPA